MDADKIQNIKKEYDIDIEQLAKRWNVDFEDTRQAFLKNVIFTNLISDLTCKASHIEADEIAWSILDHLLQGYGFSMKALSRLTDISEDDIVSFHQRKDVCLETKYKLICRLFRITNLLISSDEQLKMLTMLSK